VESFDDRLEYGAEEDDESPEYEEMHPPGERLTQQLALSEGYRHDILQPGADGIEAVFLPADAKKADQPPAPVGEEAEGQNQNDREYDRTHKGRIENEVKSSMN
jgi:hypothetical protein